jgi:hypothetical protein
VAIHNKLADHTVNSGDGLFKFLPYQLWMVGYWPTMALTGNGGLGFDSNHSLLEIVLVNNRDQMDSMNNIENFLTA